MEFKSLYNRLSKPGLTAFIAVLVLASLATAGSLTPPGAPAPTFKTLGQIFESIASDSFDSSSFTASTSGSLINHLLFIEENLGWASASNNIFSNTSGNVGIGDSTPEAKFEVVGLASVSSLLVGGASIQGVTSNSLDFDEFEDALDIDANTTITGGVFALTFDHASTSGTFETSTLNADTIQNSTGTLTINAFTLGGAVTGNSQNITGLAQLTVDNLRLDGNTLDSTTGDIVIAPNSALTTITGAASVSTNFEVVGYASVSQLFGAGLVDCDTSTDKLIWDDATGTFMCGVDNVNGGGGSGLEVREFGNGFGAVLSTMSFRAAHFALVASGSVDVSVGIDWGGGGPASLSQNETVTGAWTFSTNPTFSSAVLVASNSLDFDEFVDAMTLDANTTISNAGFALTFQNTSVSGNFELSGTVSSNLTPTVDLTHSLGTSALRWLGLFANNASISGNLEVLSVASVSQLFVGGTEITGRGVTSNSLDFDEFVDSMTLDANLTVASSSSGYTVDWEPYFVSNLTPNVDNSFSLGKNALRWSELFVASGSLHIGAAGNDSSITYETSSGSVDFMAFQPDGVITEFRIFEGGNASISGNLEVVGEFTAGTINLSSLSGNLEIAGYASASQYFSGGLADCDGTTDKLAWTASGSEAGHFSCITDQDTGTTNGWIDDGSVVRLATDTDNVGIGTSTPVSILDVSDANLPGALTLSRRDTSVSTGEDIGRIDFWNNDTQLTTQNIYARILVEADTGIGSDAAAGRMSFFTTGPTVGGSPIERLRITSTGSFGFGTTSPTAFVDLNPPSGKTGDLFRIASGSSERLIVQSDGNIGIGDTTPAFVLAVDGVSHPEGAAVFHGFTGFGGSTTAWGASRYENIADADKAVVSIMGAQFADATDRNLVVSSFTSSGTPDFVIRGDGNASVSANWEWLSGYVKFDDGTRTAPSIRFDTNGVHNNRGIYFNTSSGYDTINIVGENLQHAMFDVSDGTICFESTSGNPICEPPGAAKLYVEGVAGSNDIVAFASANNVVYFRVNETGTFNAGGNGVTPTTNNDFNSIGSFGNVTGFGATFINSGDDLRIDGNIELFTGSFIIDSNGGGTISNASGTAGAPSYSFNTGTEAGMDSDTGMWRSAADTINFSTGGLERMEISTTGNVGINDSSPVSTLDILASASRSVFRVASGSTNELFEIFGSGDVLIHGIADPVGNVGIGTTVLTQAFVTIQGVTNNTGAIALLIEDNNGSDTFKVFDNGSASISASLEVFGDDFGVGPQTRGAPPSAQTVRMDLSELSFKGGSSDPSIGFNAYFDSTDHRYISSDEAFRIQQNNSAATLAIDVAASGTAGNVVSFTNAVTINTSGNVAINTGVLQISGTSFVTYNRLGTNTTGHSLNANEDLLITDDLEVDGTIFADGGITMGADIALGGNNITGGGSFSGTSVTGTTVSMTGGGSFGASVSAIEFLAGNGSAGAPSYTFTSDENMGMFKSGSNLGFAVGGSEIGHFDSAGLDVIGAFTTTTTIVATTTITATGGFIDGGGTGVDRNCGATQALIDITVSGGIVTAGACGITSDFAENFFSKDAQLTQGDLVIAYPSGSIELVGEYETYDNQAVIRSGAPYQSTIVGVFSTHPAIVIGPVGDENNPVVPIALAGRVPVKVTGDVAVGDMLTSSELPGVTMKATQPGIVVGMALSQPYTSGSQEFVMVFVRPQYWAPSIDTSGDIQLAEFEISDSFIRSLFEEIVTLFAEMFNITFEDGTIKTNRGEFNVLKTDVLCLDDLCVTKDELRSLLNAGEVEPVNPTPEPSETPVSTPLEEPIEDPGEPEPTGSPGPEPTETPEPSESPPVPSEAEGEPESTPTQEPAPQEPGEPEPIEEPPAEPQGDEEL